MTDRGVPLFKTDRVLVQKRKLQLGNWVVVDKSGEMYPPLDVVRDLLPMGVTYQQTDSAPHYVTGQIVAVLAHSEAGIVYGVRVHAKVYFYAERSVNFIR